MSEKIKAFLGNPGKRTSAFDIISILFLCIFGLNAMIIMYLLFALNAFLFYRDYKNKKGRVIFLILGIIFLLIPISSFVLRILNVSFTIYAGRN